MALVHVYRVPRYARNRSRCKCSGQFAMSSAFKRACKLRVSGQTVGPACAFWCFSWAQKPWVVLCLSRIDEAKAMIESIDDNVSLVVARETMLQAEDMRRGLRGPGSLHGYRRVARLANTVARPSSTSHLQCCRCAARDLRRRRRSCWSRPGHANGRRPSWARPVGSLRKPRPGDAGS